MGPRHAAPSLPTLLSLEPLGSVAVSASWVRPSALPSYIPVPGSSSQQKVGRRTTGPPKCERQAHFPCLPLTSLSLCPFHLPWLPQPSSPCRVVGDRRVYSGCPWVVWESGDSSSSSSSNIASGMVTWGQGGRPCPLSSWTLPSPVILPAHRLCVPQTI